MAEIGPGSCDLFLCLHVIELVPSQQYGLRLLDTAAELLAPGGLALVQTKYSTSASSSRSRRRVPPARSRGHDDYPIDEFWIEADERGLRPLAITLVPQDPLDERYAYLPAGAGAFVTTPVGVGVATRADSPVGITGSMVSSPDRGVMRRRVREGSQVAMGLHGLPPVVAGARGWRSSPTDGTFPDWSPYKGHVIEEVITFKQENRWYGNACTGPWTFTALDAGRRMSHSQRQAAPYRQDARSTFASSPATAGSASPSR